MDGRIKTVADSKMLMIMRDDDDVEEKKRKKKRMCDEPGKINRK